jgi:hypothetical protein
MLPPDLVAKLNECAKTNLIGARYTWFYWQSIFSWAVILGLLLEGPEVVHDVLSIVRSRIIWSEKGVERAKLAAFLGWIFIIAGLLGESRAGSKIVDLSASIQECSDARVKEATLEAGDAAVSAKTAHDEADAAVKSASDAGLESDAAAQLAEKAKGKAEKVEKRADKISARLDVASRQLSQVEERVRVQGPRSKLLIDGQNAFVEALKPFKGQRVLLVTCAPRQSPLQTDEEYDFELILLNRLVEPRPGSVPGAGWTVLTEGHDSSYPCKASGWGRGVWVMYSAPSAKAAAEALGRALNELKINADTTWIRPKDASEFARQKRQPNDFNALWEKVAREPTGIYVLTGENPQTFDPRK